MARRKESKIIYSDGRVANTTKNLVHGTRRSVGGAFRYVTGDSAPEPIQAGRKATALRLLGGPVGSHVLTSAYGEARGAAGGLRQSYSGMGRNIGSSFRSRGGGYDDIPSAEDSGPPAQTSTSRPTEQREKRTYNAPDGSSVSREIVKRQRGAIVYVDVRDRMRSAGRGTNQAALASTHSGLRDDFSSGGTMGGSSPVIASKPSKNKWQEDKIYEINKPSKGSLSVRDLEFITHLSRSIVSKMEKSDNERSIGGLLKSMSRGFQKTVVQLMPNMPGLLRASRYYMLLPNAQRVGVFNSMNSTLGMIYVALRATQAETHRLVYDLIRVNKYGMDVPIRVKAPSEVQTVAEFVAAGPRRLMSAVGRGLSDYFNFAQRGLGFGEDPNRTSPRGRGGVGGAGGFGGGGGRSRSLQEHLLNIGGMAKTGAKIGIGAYGANYALGAMGAFPAIQGATGLGSSFLPHLGSVLTGLDPTMVSILGLLAAPKLIKPAGKIASFGARSLGTIIKGKLTGLLGLGQNEEGPHRKNLSKLLDKYENNDLRLVGSKLLTINNSLYDLHDDFNKSFGKKGFLTKRFRGIQDAQEDVVKNKNWWERFKLLTGGLAGSFGGLGGKLKLALGGLIGGGMIAAAVGGALEFFFNRRQNDGYDPSQTIDNVQDWWGQDSMSSYGRASNMSLLYHAQGWAASGNRSNRNFERRRGGRGRWNRFDQRRHPSPQPRPTLQSGVVPLQSNPIQQGQRAFNQSADDALQRSIRSDRRIQRFRTAMGQPGSWRRAIGRGGVAGIGLGAFDAHRRVEAGMDKDEAFTGAAGGMTGAAIGGAIGSVAIPIPVVGTLVGATVGGLIGDYIGSAYSEEVKSSLQNFLGDETYELVRDMTLGLGRITAGIIDGGMTIFRGVQNLSANITESAIALLEGQKWRDRLKESNLEANERMEEQGATSFLSGGYTPVIDDINSYRRTTMFNTGTGVRSAQGEYTELSTLLGTNKAIEFINTQTHYFGSVSGYKHVHEKAFHYIIESSKEFINTNNLTDRQKIAFANTLLNSSHFIRMGNASDDPQVKRNFDDHDVEVLLNSPDSPEAKKIRNFRALWIAKTFFGVQNPEKIIADIERRRKERKNYVDGVPDDPNQPAASSEGEGEPELLYNTVSMTGSDSWGIQQDPLDPFGISSGSTIYGYSEHTMRAGAINPSYMDHAAHYGQRAYDKISEYAQVAADVSRSALNTAAWYITSVYEYAVNRWHYYWGVYEKDGLDGIRDLFIEHGTKFKERMKEWMQAGIKKYNGITGESINEYLNYGIEKLQDFQIIVKDASISMIGAGLWTIREYYELAYEAFVEYRNIIKEKMSEIYERHPRLKELREEYVSNFMDDFSSSVGEPIVDRFNRAKEYAGSVVEYGRDKITDLSYNISNSWNTSSKITIPDDFIYKDYVMKAARTYDLDPNLIYANLMTESAGDPNARSHAGATGLMQLMPGTASDMGVTDITDPYQNIMGGSNYMRQMIDRFGGNIPIAIGAYNVGPDAMNRYLGGRDPRTITFDEIMRGGWRGDNAIAKNKETYNHIKRVMNRWGLDNLHGDVISNQPLNDKLESIDVPNMFEESSPLDSSASLIRNNGNTLSSFMNSDMSNTNDNWNVISNETQRVNDGFTVLYDGPKSSYYSDQGILDSNNLEEESNMNRLASSIRGGLNRLGDSITDLTANTRNAVNTTIDNIVSSTQTNVRGGSQGNINGIEGRLDKILAENPEIKAIIQGRI